MADSREPVERDATATAIKSDTDRGLFLGNPLLDNLFAAFIALNAEVWSNRRRLHVLEGALAATRALTPDTLEAYRPTPAEETAWKEERDRFVRTTFAPFLDLRDVPFASLQALRFPPDENQ